jgi:hypothetical protein
MSEKDKLQNKMYLKSFYERHPEKKKSYKCSICGGMIDYSQQTHHTNRKKHINALIILNMGDKELILNFE